MATSNVRTPWQDLGSAQKAAGRVSDLEDVIAQLSTALEPGNLRKASPMSPDWARYGYAAVDPTTKTFVQPTMYNNKQYVGSMQKQLSSALHEKAITDAALELFSPYNPPAVKQPRIPGVTRPAGKLVGGAGLAGLLLDLLTYSGDTNANEAEDLTAKRGPEYTNKPEYDRLLQQALQQLQGRILP